MLAAIYLRLSRDEEKQGLEDILYNHREALVKLANGNNFKYEIYQEVSSGKNNERHELNKLLERIADYDYVLVMDLDRLTRDNIYALQLKQKFIINDIKIITPNGEINFENESDNLSYSIKSMFSEYEWAQIRKRMGRGRLAAAGQGKWVGSNRIPLGFAKDENKRLVIVENEAKIIRFIFEKIIQGYSTNRISKELDMLCWRSRQGKIITTSHITLIRKNPVYYGCVAMKQRTNGKVVDEVFVENAHEAIIPKQLWLEVQEIAEGRSKEFKFRQKGSITRKLQGLIYCNCCGRKRYIQKDGSGVDYIKTCSYKVDNNKCEDRGHKYLPVEEDILEAVKNEKTKIIKELEQLESTDVSSIESKLEEQKISLKRNLTKINNRRKNLTIMRSDGEITKKEFEELKDEFEFKIHQLEQQIQLIDEQKESLSNTEVKQEQLRNTIYNIEHLDEFGIEETNAFLKSIIRKIKFSSNMKSSHDTTKSKPNPTIKIDWIQEI
ncbi:recombinase family protein [Peribacillus sp. NPDC097198]|uniref:recombinase family protein n=1 Tax=Peribacillus sp. NPDC097198 TaxID=3364397 RepID=UPI00382C106C